MQKVSFPGSQGHQLVGWLHKPLGPIKATALFAHCFTCSKDLRAARLISLELADAGIATLRFDFTGLGESQGEFSDTNYSSNVDDLLAAATFLRENHSAPQLLVGHSLGGAAMLTAAPQITEAKAVVTIGAPCEPQHVRKLIDNQAPNLAQNDSCPVTIAGRTFRLKQQLIDDLENQRQLEALPRLGKALLVLHSALDNIVGVDNARCIFAAAKHPKSFISLDNADHLLSKARDAIYAGQLIAAWAARYLDEPSDDHALEHGHVRVQGGDKTYTNAVSMGRHAAIADEPTTVGGSDLGPAPYEYLLAGLGACTSMTLRMYADRKGLPLERVTVTLAHGRIHAEDCADCEKQSGRVDVIERQIRIEGPLTDKQRARMLEIADKCPVHRTLTNEIKIRTRFADDQ